MPGFLARLGRRALLRSRARVDRFKLASRRHVRLRLMDAIEASGLSIEDYASLVRVQDESTNALLDDAIAELGREAAKREALMRAFTASGRTEAEFADMYGMDPDEVASVLARVRQDQIKAVVPATEVAG